MSESKIVVSSGGVMHQGLDATKLYQAKVVRQGVRACRKGMRLNRNYTPSRVLAAAGSITGQTYKRGQYDRAEADLDSWIQQTEATIPVEHSTGGV